MIFFFQFLSSLCPSRYESVFHINEVNVYLLVAGYVSRVLHNPTTMQIFNEICGTD